MSKIEDKIKQNWSQEKSKVIRLRIETINKILREVTSIVTSKDINSEIVSQLVEIGLEHYNSNEGSNVHRNVPNYINIIKSLDVFFAKNINNLIINEEDMSLFEEVSKIVKNNL